MYNIWGREGLRERLRDRSEHATFRGYNPVVRCIVLQGTATHCNTLEHTATPIATRCLSCAATHCNIVQHKVVKKPSTLCVRLLSRMCVCVAVCCSVLQCVAVCCSVLQPFQG